jgi:hypothetical protein
LLHGHRPHVLRIPRILRQIPPFKLFQPIFIITSFIGRIGPPLRLPDIRWGASLPRLVFINNTTAII